MTLTVDERAQTEPTDAETADRVTRDPSYTVAFRYFREQLGTYRIVHVRADDGMTLPSEGELAEIIAKHLRKTNRDAFIDTDVKRGNSKSLGLGDIYSHEQVRFLKEEPKRAERRVNGGRTDLEKIGAAARQYVKDGLSKRDAFFRATAEHGWTKERAEMLWEVAPME